MGQRKQELKVPVAMVFGKLHARRTPSEGRICKPGPNGPDHLHAPRSLEVASRPYWPSIASGVSSHHVSGKPFPEVCEWYENGSGFGMFRTSFLMIAT